MMLRMLSYKAMFCVSLFKKPMCLEKFMPTSYSLLCGEKLHILSLLTILDPNQLDASAFEMLCCESFYGS